MKKFIANTEPDSSSSEDQKKPVVFLSLSNSEDRKLVQSFLSPNFTVKIDQGDISGQTFDLCILDQQAFYQKKEVLRKMKRQAEPLFLPFLLLSNDPQQTRREPVVLEFADDVVYIPVSTKVLETRIDLLLRQRDYSLELEQKNQQLAEQNEQLHIYEEAINAMNAGVLITDPCKEDNPIVFCNQGFRELTGYEENEILGRNCRFLQGDDRDQQEIEKIRSILDSNTKGQVRLRNYRKDGTQFWNDLSLAPIKDEDGNVHHFVGIQRDVTELVEIQKELQEKEERYRLIAENSTDMISRHTPEGVYLYISEASQELIGYAPEELVGRNAFENIHPEDAEMLREKVDDFQKDEIQRWTFRKRMKKGKYKWVESVMRPIFDDDTGELVEIQASTRDISDRKEYERMLEGEKEFIDTALESLPGIFYMLDEDLNFIKWNKNFRKFLGYTDEEIKGMTPADFYNKETIPLIHQKIREVYDTGAASIEAKIRKKNGELVPHYLIARRLTRDGETFIIGTGVDVSERVEATKKLAESEQRWASLVQNDPNLVQIFAPDGTISFINESGAKLLGFEGPEEVIGRNYFDLMNLDKKELARTKNRISKVVKQGISVPPHIYRLRREDGEEIYLESQKVPIEQSDGQIWVQQVAKNVTDRVKYEQNLKESERRWGQLVEKNPSLVQLTDRNNIVRYLNPAGAELYGVDDPKQVVGKPFTDFIIFDEKSVLKDRMGRAFNGEILPPITYKVRTVKSGEDRFIELQGVAVSHHDEQVVMTVGKDVTEKYRYEQQMRQSLEEKNTLLQEIHHRVKNNLAVVSGMLQLQMFSSDNKELQKSLGDSEKRIKTMALIHEQLYQSTSLSKIDFGAYIQELVQNIREVSHNKEKVQLDLACGNIELNVNQAVPCALILNEVISNAYEHAFTEQDSGKIEIRLKEQDDAVFVQVRDNGRGIDKGVLKHHENSMGFTIIDTLIKQLDADLDIQSNGGVDFSFSFKKQQIRGSSSAII